MITKERFSALASNINNKTRLFVEALHIGFHGYEDRSVLWNISPLPLSPSPSDNTWILIKDQDVEAIISDNLIDNVLVMGKRAYTKDTILLGELKLSEINPIPKGVSQIEVTFEVQTVSAADNKIGILII
ncbi:2347_t:CDS:2 [Funneliformis mosseae]|uniref:2347_t:CDS:1 n=1 Tax=Funneliformis mosseae TaxID=27381 RepID=A0A9N8ZBR5_FUNMO|nr:2347_t:CDS:2 [Funneliformis mosseae]